MPTTSPSPKRAWRTRADAEGQVLADRVGSRSVRGRVLGPARRRLAARVERDELALGHLAQESRGLADAVAVDAPMERVREMEPLAGARQPHVAEASLLLDFVLVVHRAG